MTNTISTKNLFRAIFKLEQQQIFAIKNISLVHPLIVKFTFDPFFDGAYTRPLKQKKTYRICIGGAFIKNALGLQDRIKASDFNSALVRDIDRLFRGLYYHEVGHLRYTDMKDTRVFEYPEEELRPFVKKLSNILEDIAMENFGMAVAFPYTKKYFHFIIKKVFLPTCARYEDKEDAGSFLSFLLLKLRCGKEFLGTNKFYSDNEKVLWPMIKDVLTEPNGTERITKTLVLAEWIFKNAPFDCRFTTPDDIFIDVDWLTPGKSDPSRPLKKDEREHSIDGGLGRDTGKGSGCSSDDRGQDETDTCSFDPKSIDEIASGSDTEDIEETYDPTNDPALCDLEEISDSFNDVLGCADHYEIIAKQYFVGSDSVTNVLRDRIVKYGSLITAIKDAIAVYQSRIKPKYTPGFSNGKLSLKTVIKAKASGVPNAKPFMKKIESQVAPDLAICLVVDNSGSMEGNKSHICTNSSLALAQACELVKVPIEVSCFTEKCNNAITIHIKSFNESLEQSLPYFGLLDSDLCKSYSYDKDEIPLFFGNIDEVNIYHIWKNFLKCPHKNKLMIVISDGETCGSSETLRNLVKDIEASGIHVIGLGIQSRAAASIYPDCKTFVSNESLNELPEFMTDLLLKYSRGGK